jgi:transposase-like zinc-binding protein/putative transposase
MRSEILPKRIEDPMKQILIDAQEIWDHDGTRPCVRESFSRMIECRTPALGWLTYASETEVMRVYHTCKARFCPSCGYRATLQWQREQWTQLPALPYCGLVFTMPGCLWRIFKENRHLLHDLPTIGGEAVMRWMDDAFGVKPLILVVQHTFGRHLNFNAHLHMLVSAGGLSESESPLRFCKKAPIISCRSTKGGYSGKRRSSPGNARSFNSTHPCRRTESWLGYF